MLTALELRANLKRAVELLEKVISQTERRVFRGEKVPVSEKVVSYFEDHTDIIVKSRREASTVTRSFSRAGNPI